MKVYICKKTQYWDNEKTSGICVAKGHVYYVIDNNLYSMRHKHINRVEKTWMKENFIEIKSSLIQHMIDRSVYIRKIMNEFDDKHERRDNP